MGLLVSDILQEAEALCRECAPHELAGVPLYIVPKRDLPEERRGLPEYTAWTGPTTDLEVRDVIGARWAGRGPCMVVDDQRERWSVLGAALHELAHILDRPALYGELPAGVSLEQRAAANVAHLASAHPVAAQIAAHPASWCRLAFHLAHRAQRTEVPDAPGAELVAYKFLSPVLIGMFRATYFECHQWERRPLAELKTIPAPRPFLELYQTAVKLAELEPVGAA